MSYRFSVFFGALATTGVIFGLFEDKGWEEGVGAGQTLTTVFNFGHATRILANQFALRFRAFRLRAFPVANRLVTNCVAFRSGSLIFNIFTDLGILKIRN
jgi:hypothetical protein